MTHSFRGVKVCLLFSVIVFLSLFRPSYLYASGNLHQVHVAKMSKSQIEKLWQNMGPSHSIAEIRTAQVTTSSGQEETEVVKEAPKEGSVEKPKKAYEIHGEERFGGYYDNVTGNKANAQMDEGPQFLQELDLSLLHHGKNGREFEMVFNTRLTDDKYVDTEHASIVDFHINVSNQGYLFTLGDYLGTLSDFTFNQALRGVYLEKEFADLKGLKVIALAGIQNDRWESFWKNIEGESYDRYYEGVRVSFLPLKPLTIGFNFINGKDDPASVSGSTNPALEGRVGSVDFALNLLDSALNFGGEAAWSWYKSKLMGDNALSEAVENRGSITDGAYRLTGDYEKGIFAAHAGYSRVEPKFRSLGGMSSPDTEEYFGIVDLTPLPQVTLEAGYRGSRDNLDGQLNTTTRYKMPEISITFQEIPHLENLTVSFKYNRSSTDTGDDSVDDDTDTYSANLNYSLYKFNLSLEGEYRDKKDHVDRINNIKDHRFGVRLDRSFEKGIFQFSPYIGFEWEREKGHVTGEQAPISVGGLSQLEVSTADFVPPVYETLRYTRTYSAGCQMNIGKDWDMDVAYSYLDENVNAAGGGNNSETTSLEANLTYRIFGHEDRILNLYYKLDDHNFELGSDDYREEVYGFQLTKRF